MYNLLIIRKTKKFENFDQNDGLTPLQNRQFFLLF